MHLSSISLINFKNYEQTDLEFSSKINCFVGENGIGKTNMLDAIHYLALCKSNLNPIDSQNIRYEQDMSLIQGVFLRLEKEETIYCSIRKNKKKQFKRNKKEYKRLMEHIGLIPIVMISPADYSLIQGGSEERRRLMNSVIGQYDHIYLENIIAYNRVLSQRNSLLKEMAGRPNNLDVLEVLDQQMIQYGKPVYEARLDFAEKLMPVFQQYYQHVSGMKEEVTLAYKSQLHDRNFGEILLESRNKDLAIQYTTAGIHKDDLQMMLTGHPLKKVGSQGQQKTFLVALKLAEFEFMQKLMELPPILLLDDVFDKLDAFRVKQIIKLVAKNKFGQIFITDTNEKRVKEILKEIPAENKIYHIKKSGPVEIQ